MQSAPIPSNEKERLDSLYKLKILDTKPEERFDRITRLAVKLFKVPISTITLIDSKREWFKSCQGLTNGAGDRAVSFCGHAMQAKGAFIIPDTTKDERFADNPLVTGEPYIRFYAAVPLVGPDGISVGAFCIKDHKPREMSEDEIKSLRDLGVWAELELNMHELSSALDARRKAEEELEKEKLRIEEANSKNEALLASIGDGVVATDKEGSIITLNKQTENLLALKKEEVLGKKYYDLWSIEDEKGNVVPVEDRPIQIALTQQKNITTSDYYYVRPDKTKFPVAITAAPIILNGVNIGAIGVFRDITKEKQLNKLKDQFVSIASHELRTPMTAIKGFVSLILEGTYGPINDSLKMPLGEISNATERLIRLVNDILNVSRIESGGIKLVISDFKINDVINETISSLSPLAKNKGIYLKAESLPSCVIQSDVNKVKEILINIMGNALKFTDKGGIDVSVKENENLVTIVITDTGIGISKENQEKVFGKFEQINSQEKGRPDGTGLGLYISREFARSLGGDLQLKDSELGKGTVFAFSLPKNRVK